MVKSAVGQIHQIGYIELKVGAVNVTLFEFLKSVFLDLSQYGEP